MVLFPMPIYTLIKFLTKNDESIFSNSSTLLFNLFFSSFWLWIMLSFFTISFCNFAIKFFNFIISFSPSCTCAPSYSFFPFNFLLTLLSFAFCSSDWANFHLTLLPVFPVLGSACLSLRIFFQCISRTLPIVDFWREFSREWEETPPVRIYYKVLRIVYWGSYP